MRTSDRDGPGVGHVGAWAGEPRARLVAVDLGLRAGIATFGDDGRLRTYRSTNFGSRSRLRAGAPAVIGDLPGVTTIVVEGDRTLARLWLRAAERRGCIGIEVAPEVWRDRLLPLADRRSGDRAKQAADRLARRVIDWSGAARPTSLRHDAAEAICIGLWAVLDIGWLPGLPPELR